MFNWTPDASGKTPAGLVAGANWEISVGTTWDDAATSMTIASVHASAMTSIENKTGRDLVMSMDDDDDIVHFKVFEPMGSPADIAPPSRSPQALALGASHHSASVDGQLHESDDEGEVDPNSDPKNLLVAGIHPDLSDEGFFDLFKPFGDLISAMVTLDVTTGKSRGFGFLAFRNSEDGQRAIEAMHKKVHDGLTLRVLPSLHAHEAPRSESIFVRNLPISVTYPEARRIFDQFGPVKELRVDVEIAGARRRRNRFQWAVVVYERVESADKCIQALHLAKTIAGDAMPAVVKELKLPLVIRFYSQGQEWLLSCPPKHKAGAAGPAPAKAPAQATPPAPWQNRPPPFPMPTPVPTPMPPPGWVYSPAGAVPMRNASPMMALPGFAPMPMPMPMAMPMPMPMPMPGMPMGMPHPGMPLPPPGFAYAPAPAFMPHPYGMSHVYALPPPLR